MTDPRTSSGTADGVFVALADPTRRQILDLLAADGDRRLTRVKRISEEAEASERASQG